LNSVEDKLWGKFAKQRRFFCRVKVAPYLKLRLGVNFPQNTISSKFAFDSLGKIHLVVNSEII
jgi:hypothetical protein